VPKVPSGFHAATEDALKLARADAFLAGAHEVDGLKPEPEREFAFLENGAHPDRKRLPAGVAFPQPGPGSLAGKTSDLGLIGVLAVRTDRARRPKLVFYVLESRIFVVEAIFGKN
jgi:hypothetical protein